jgi:hypothetical protein
MNIILPQGTDYSADYMHKCMEVSTTYGEELPTLNDYHGP